MRIVYRILQALFGLLLVVFAVGLGPMCGDRGFPAYLGALVGALGVNMFGGVRRSPRAGWLTLAGGVAGAEAVAALRVVLHGSSCSGLASAMPMGLVVGAGVALVRSAVRGLRRSAPTELAEGE